MMLATWILSGWISNTATTLMMLPVALALCERFATLRTKQALLLGIAYAASIGGIATPIGTPPNVVLMGIYEETTGLELSFSTWLSFGYPLALGLVAAAWLLLVRSLGPLTDLTMSQNDSASLGRSSAGTNLFPRAACPRCVRRDGSCLDNPKRAFRRME